MTALTWSEALALQQPQMDDTHREFVDLLAELESRLEGPQAAIDECLDRFVAHTEAHFGQEERWMGALGFAAENCHAFQHAHVLQVLRAVRQRSANLEYVTQLVIELAKWFPSHAQTMDAALAQTMTELGYDPASGSIERAPATGAAPITGCGSASCSG